MPLGAGTTAPANQNFVLSRPQVNLGEIALDYIPTDVPPVVTFLDNFNGVAGTVLSAHTPDLGTGWVAQGSELGITANSSAQARGTGTGAGNPNYHGNRMNVPAPVGRKLIRFTSSGGYGGTSLVQGVFVKSSVDGTSKITCGFATGNSLRFQVWQAGAFTDTIIGTVPDTANGTTAYPEEFFVVIDGDLITCGYGDWVNPRLVGTYDTSTLTGLGDGIGLIMRTSGPDGIYSISYADI